MAASQTGDLLGLDNPSEGRSNNNPGLTLNLGSNNPFRNRAASPNNLSPAPHSPFDDPPPRPTSRNPFLDILAGASIPDRAISPDKMTSLKGKTTPTAEDIFDNLTLEDDKTNRTGDVDVDGKPPMPKNRPPGPPRPRGENMPPRGRGGRPVHRPSRSQEEAMKARRGPPGPGGRPSGSSPQRRPMERRPRRNSESSVADKEKPLTEEEKKARDARRKERERRHREREREREGKSSKDAKGKPSKKLDLIDALDATSIYGTGLFHHDGPFDACNPNRNRQGSRRAPMSAFAKDSANMSLGGSGPLNKRPDHATFMGNHADEFITPHAAASNAPDTIPRTEKESLAFFDATSRGSILHGDESMGLGTSTFFEGTPATRTAIQRRQAETVQETTEGLGRKKSLAHRIRNINRAPAVPGRNTNPEGVYGPRSGDSTSERNPFAAEFDKAEERIAVKRTDSQPMSPSTPPVPGAPLERRVTADAATTLPSPETTPKTQGGFLSRVKSLKGGRRTRPEVPSKPAPVVPEAVPGTAV